MNISSSALVSVNRGGDHKIVAPVKRGRIARTYDGTPEAKEM